VAQQQKSNFALAVFLFGCEVKNTSQGNSVPEKSSRTELSPLDEMDEVPMLLFH